MNKKQHKRTVPLCCDVAVIGAGPAGSLTAALAAEAGFSVVILEQKKLPRKKTCGGLISDRSLSLLPHDFILPPELVSPVHMIRVSNRKRCYHYKSSNRLGIIVERAQFDYQLTHYACQKGAVLYQDNNLQSIEEINVTHSGHKYFRINTKARKEEPITARYVVGADGALSRCALLSELKTKHDVLTGWGLSRSVTVEDEPEKTGQIAFYPLPFLGGMGWLFNGPGWINRGVGGLASRCRLQKAYYHLFPEEHEKPAVPAWPLPFLGPLRKAACRNLLLVGDAVGLVDPFSGEGLYNSLKSSILAVSSLLRAEQENIYAEQIYHKLFRDSFRKSLFTALGIAIIMHGRFLTCPESTPRLMAGLMQEK